MRLVQFDHNFILFEYFRFNTIVYVLYFSLSFSFPDKGLLSLVVLVGLLGIGAKMNYISPTVCGYCFRLVNLFFSFSLKDCFNYSHPSQDSRHLNRIRNMLVEFPSFPLLDEILNMWHYIKLK